MKWSQVSKYFLKSTACNQELKICRALDVMDSVVIDYNLLELAYPIIQNALCNFICHNRVSETLYKAQQINIHYNKGIYLKHKVHIATDQIVYMVTSGLNVKSLLAIMIICSKWWYVVLDTPHSKQMGKVCRPTQSNA